MAPVLMMATALIGAPPAGGNLLANPGFEDVGADGLAARWNPLRGAPATCPDDGGHSGQRYLRLSDRDPKQGVSVESEHLPCRPGGVYRLSGWLRTADQCSPGLYLQFHREGGERIAEVHGRAAGPTDGWFQVSVTAVAPDEAESVSALVYGYTAEVGTVDADDLSLTVSGGAEPGSGGVPRAEPGGKEPIDIGSSLELFVDDHLIDGLSGDARRVLHHPVPANDALRLDAPWEGPVSAYFTVFRDGDKVRLYYRGGAFAGKPELTCYAESPDGVTFTKPKLGLFELDGSKDNGIVWMGPGTHNFSPFLDANPAAPAEQRYKAVAGAPLAAFVSADGLRWRRLREEPIITKGAFDSHNLAFWDAARGEYVCYFRTFRDGVRSIDRTTSKDFLTWSDPVTLTYGDVPPEHLYTNNILPYPRAPHLLIGLPARFVPHRQKVAEHPHGGVSDALLMSSRDGVRFDRWREAFLLPGPDPRSWTDRTNYPAWGMVQTSPTELSIYWTHHYRHDDYTLRRGTIRLDGFVSVHGGVPGGELLTRPMTVRGARLVINAATSAGGSLRFELCDAAGRPLPGYELGHSEVYYGDEIEHTVTWSGSPPPPAGPVRLRVRLRDADLYSFRFSD